MVLPDQRIAEGFPRAATLRPRSANGADGRPLHLTLHYATVGMHGMHVHGTDSTGMLRLRLRVDRPEGEQGSNVGVLLQYGPENSEHAALVLPLPATWSNRDMRDVGILGGLLRDHEVSMPLRTMVCHQISTAEEARTYLDYVETGHGARLDFELVGWSLPVGEAQIRVDPLFVAFSRARITNAAEVSAALTVGERIVPVNVGPAPGSTVLGRRTPFPGPCSVDSPAAQPS